MSENEKQLGKDIVNGLVTANGMFFGTMSAIYPSATPVLAGTQILFSSSVDMTMNGEDFGKQVFKIVGGISGGAVCFPVGVIPGLICSEIGSEVFENLYDKTYNSLQDHQFFNDLELLESASKHTEEGGYTYLNMTQGGSLYQKQNGNLVKVEYPTYDSEVDNPVLDIQVKNTHVSVETDQGHFDLTVSGNNTTINTNLELNSDQKTELLKSIAPQSKPGDSITINDDVYHKHTGKHDGGEEGILAEGEAVEKHEVADGVGGIATVVKEETVTLSDGTTASSNSVISMGIAAKEAFSKFITNGYDKMINHITNIETAGSWAADIGRLLADGESNEKIAEYILIKELVNGSLGIVLPSVLTQQDQQAITQYINTHGSTEGLDSSLQEKLDTSLVGLEHSTEYRIARGAIISFITTSALRHDDGLNGEEYGMIGLQAVSSQVAQETITSFMGNEAGTGGVVVAATYVISTGLQDIFADDHLNSHQWSSVVNTAVAIGLGYTLGSMLIPIPYLGGMIGSMVVSEMIGGKEYGAGEYPDPYSFLKLVAKEDGLGNIIYGLEQEGVVARARDGFDDDIVGTAGNDNLIGGDGTNVITGRGGNDHLEGRDDVDQIYGGEGDDLIEAGGSDDYVSGGSGDDTIHGDTGNDQLEGDEGNDIIYGDSGDDVILGGLGDDTISGGLGSDQIVGGSGNDSIQGDAGVDILFGEDGKDRLYGGEDNDQLTGGAGEDILIAGSGNDVVYGGTEDDIVIGGKGQDTLYGDNGADLMSGGDDNDLLYGGLGNDQLGGAAGDDIVMGEITSVP